MSHENPEPQGRSILIGSSANLSEHAYWSSFSVRELSPQFIATSKPKTLANLRKRTPPSADFVVPILPAVVAHNFVGATALESLEKTFKAADILGADQLLLRTPATFRPTQSNRDALSQFLNTHCDGKVKVAWWAEGLWPSQPDAQIEVKANSSVMLVEDPFALDDDEVLVENENFYWRLMGGRGMRRGLNDDELEQLIDESSARASGTIIFAAPAVQADAKRFHRLMAYASDF